MNDRAATMESGEDCTERDALRAANCFAKTFCECSARATGDEKADYDTLYNGLCNAYRVLLDFGIGETCLRVAWQRFRELLARTIAPTLAKRKRKREWARRKRAAMTPEQADAYRAKARERMRLARAKRTPTQKEAAREYARAWAKANPDKIRANRKRFLQAHPKRKRKARFVQGVLF